MVKVGKSRTELAKISDQAECYAFFKNTDIEDSDIVIISTISICDWMTYVKFDSGSAYSYMFVQFMVGLNLVYVVFDYLVYVPTLVGKYLVVTYVYHYCSILFMGFQT